jgi:hypothetical protein
VLSVVEALALAITTASRRLVLSVVEALALAITTASRRLVLSVVEALALAITTAAVRDSRLLGHEEAWVGLLTEYVRILLHLSFADRWAKVCRRRGRSSFASN